MITSLVHADITNISIVVGFEAERIRTFLKQQFPDRRFRLILNPNFATTNNAYSLLLAGDFFLDSRVRTKMHDRLLVLDSDILFHPALLASLRPNNEENKIAVRVQGVHDNEEVGVVIDEFGNISKIGKGFDREKIYGESIGMECFNYASAKLLFEVLRRRIKKEERRAEYYEITFQEMIDRGCAIKATDIGDYPAIEVDSFADLEIAERTIVPKIDTASDVRIQ